MILPLPQSTSQHSQIDPQLLKSLPPCQKSAHSTTVQLTGKEGSDGCDLFDESIYNQIECFLDIEGLFIVSPTPQRKVIKLKPAFPLKTILRENSQSTESSDSLTEEDIPKFLVRRKDKQIAG